MIDKKQTQIDCFNQSGGYVIKVFNLGSEMQENYGFKKKQLKHVW